MLWLLYCLVGITIWSATAVADRFFLVTHVKSKRFYVTISALVQFPLLLVVSFFIPLPPSSFTAIIAGIASGIVGMFPLFLLYHAVSSEEVSRVFALSSLTPLVTLLLGWIFLHESLTSAQFAALGLFILGGFILAAKFDNGAWAFSRALKPLTIGMAFTACSTILLRAAFVGSDFWTGFFFNQLGSFIVGLGIVLVYGNEIFGEWRSISSRVRVAMVGNQVVSLSGHAFYYLAISLVNAALVQSVLGTQSVFVFAFALIASWWRPGVVQESLNKRDLIQKVIGIGLAVAAAILIVQ